MGIFDRIGDVIKSYIIDDDSRIFGREPAARSGDPDLDAAFDELNEFLGKDANGFAKTEYRRTEYERTKKGERYTWTEYTRTEFPGGGSKSGTRSGSTKTRGTGNGGADAGAGWGASANPELEMVKDFAELGLKPGASLDECKTARKKLLKIHHPDRHAGHAANMKKATERTARINAAYERIEKFYARG